MRHYKKTFVLLFTAAALFFSCGKPGEIAPRHHALIIMGHYQPTPGSAVTIVPYRVNHLALDLLRRGKAFEDCKHYIQWYLNHLNNGDIHGLTGTVYDYTVHPDGKESFLKSVTFAEGAAATFILLLDQYVRVTGHQKLITQNKKKIEHIAYLIPHLQDETGAVRSLPGKEENRLQGNCESLAALRTYIRWIETYGWGDEAAVAYTTVKDKLETAIRERFYRSGENEFYRLIKGLKRYPPDWNTFHPGSYAQLFPLLHRLLPGETQARELWEKFLRRHRDAISQAPLHRQLVVQWTREAMDKEKKSNEQHEQQGGSN